MKPYPDHKEEIMADNENKYVRVRDNADNEYICPIDALIDLKNATEDELDNCVDSAIAGRYAANISIVD